jgi:hypothetical protein
MIEDLERAVLDHLLAGDHPALEVLRAQAAGLRVIARKMSGVGFFTDFEVPAGARLLATPRDLELGDVDADLDGLTHGATFVLFVRKGRIDFLEGHARGEPWPTTLGTFRLRYREEPRDLRALDPPHR